MSYASAFSGFWDLGEKNEASKESDRVLLRQGVQNSWENRSFEQNSYSVISYEYGQTVNPTSHNLANR